MRKSYKTFWETVNKELLLYDKDTLCVISLEIQIYLDIIAIVLLFVNWLSTAEIDLIVNNFEICAQKSRFY